MIVEEKKIKEQILADSKINFSLDTERKRLSIESILTTKYVAIKNKDKVERLRIILRDTEYEQALMYLLPDNNMVEWVNPFKIFKQKLVQLLLDYTL